MQKVTKTKEASSTRR